MPPKKKKQNPIEIALEEVNKEADALIQEYNETHEKLKDLWARILMLSGKQQGLIEAQERIIAAAKEE